MPCVPLSVLALSLLVSTATGCASLITVGSSPDGGAAPGPSPGPDLGPPPDCGVLSLCERSCTKLDSDPMSCGACDRTCVIPNAVAGCQRGECVIASCDVGYMDLDANVANGCETASTCVLGLACRTVCDSTGGTACVAGMATCPPPAETCNGQDDNCDGRCDEGPLTGCRAGVNRSAGGGGHFYTTDPVAAMAQPFKIEAANYFYIYVTSHPGTAPVFLCKKQNGKYLLTSSPTCEAQNVAGQLLGFWLTNAICAAQPLYRLFSVAAGDHFYTVSDAERQNAINLYGYQFESIVGYVSLTP